ncbi:flagellar filament capping protein FliD [uncultured Azohydromonas sp.]|jgi:Flagellar capping protein|uniref:flagellar filament capping protein FliD n=1 Tax=uncultured Azohydromonas sp. TaxID=487342 RepID=UPI00262B92D9|nr:flagellar filament capping protein FliD [uncultured Azohydromonas sp.]
MTISSAGIGSGIDVQSLVSQLMALERKPIEQLKTAASSIQTQVSAYGKVQSLMSTLRDSAAALAKSSLWTQGTATASDTTVLTATSSGSVSAGEYDVTVNKMARAQSLYSRAMQPSDPLGTGSLTIGLVEDYGPPPKYKDGTSPVTLDFTDPDTTLSQVRDRINAAGAGVVASLVTNIDGTVQLSLTSKNTGTKDQIEMVGSGGLGEFSFAGPNDVGGTMTEGQKAQNAEITINGMTVESTTNEFKNVIGGVTLKVLKTSSDPVKVSSAADAAAQQKAVEDFMAAYNALNSYLRDQTKYDEAAKKGSPLQGDSTALGLRSQMRLLLQGSNGASPVYGSLASIGFSTATDGTLKLDTAKLKTALQQPEEVAKLFSTTDDTVPGNNGFGVRFSDLIDRLTRSDGVLSTRTAGLQSKLKRNQTEQEKIEERVARTQARLEKQYQALDTKMSSLNSLAAQVTRLSSLFSSN